MLSQHNQWRKVVLLWGCRGVTDSKIKEPDLVASLAAAYVFVFVSLAGTATRRNHENRENRKFRAENRTNSTIRNLNGLRRKPAKFEAKNGWFLVYIGGFRTRFTVSSAVTKWAVLHRFSSEIQRKPVVSTENRLAEFTETDCWTAGFRRFPPVFARFPSVFDRFPVEPAAPLGLWAESPLTPFKLS